MTGLLCLLCLMSANSLPAAESNPSQAPPALQLLELKRPLVIAHRGFSMVAPENTLPAFELALAAGADLVELDYHHSKDGALIVIHDFDVDRTTDGDELWNAKKIRVESRPAAELQRLDAGAWFKPAYKGARLPLLTEALDLIQKNGVTLIERKAGDAPACVQLLRERALINRVIVQAFDWAYLKHFHELAPEQVLGALGPPSTRNGQKLTDEQKKLSPAWVDEAQKSGVKVIGWNRQVDADAVRYAQSRGLKVWVYTINEMPLANSLLDMGVDGIISDNPALIWKVLALRGSSK